MTISYLPDLRRQRLDAVEEAIGSSPVLRLLSGSPPATCAATQTGTLLASITLPADWMAAAVVGTWPLTSKAKSGNWTGTGAVSGTPGYFRILNAAETICHIQGTAGVSGTDMLLSSATIEAGQAITVITFTLAAGNP
jgi:hypothetical protein